MTPRRRTCSREHGFSLIESIFALAILAVGLLALAQAFTLGLFHMATSSANLVAREKAREAVESVHTARDTRTITWAQIRNVAALNAVDATFGPCNSVGGGVFLNGERSLAVPGADGLINTADDGVVERIVAPGPDGAFGSVDDRVEVLNGFFRTIEICDLSAELREIRVTIRYRVGPVERRYRLQTYISSFS